MYSELFANSDWDGAFQTTVLSTLKLIHRYGHRWELSVLHYHLVMVIYPYPFKGWYFWWFTLIFQYLIPSFFLSKLPYFQIYNNLPYFWHIRKFILKSGPPPNLHIFNKNWVTFSFFWITFIIETVVSERNYQEFFYIVMQKVLLECCTILFTYFVST